MIHLATRLVIERHSESIVSAISGAHGTSCFFNFCSRVFLIWWTRMTVRMICSNIACTNLPWANCHTRLDQCSWKYSERPKKLPDRSKTKNSCTARGIQHQTWAKGKSKIHRVNKSHKRISDRDEQTKEVREGKSAEEKLLKSARGKRTKNMF